MTKRLLSLTLLIALMAALAISATSAQDDEMPTLRIAVLPVMNTLPLYVAEAEGFYEDYGVNVELIPFAGAPDQQIALQVGEVDGANTDMAVLSLLVNGGVELKAVRHEPILEPFFSVVAGAESGIDSVEDLAGVPIAISEGTIIEYLTTAMLLNAGLSPEDIVYEAVPAIPVRLELLASGQIAAATLPEPLTTLASQLQGGTVIASDATIDFVPTVLALTDDVLTNQPEAVEAFLAAYEDAVNAINADGESYREVLTANIRVPEPLQPTIPVPTFPTASAPTAAETAQVVTWMVENGLLEEPLLWEDLVTDAYLPLPRLLEIAVDAGDFTALVGAVTATGLDAALDLPGEEYTVFAPTDDAFAGVDVSGLSEDELANVLLYHVVEGEVLAADLIEAGSGEFSTLSGGTVTFEVVDGAVVLNGDLTVAMADVDAANGVIHVIDGVLLPGE